MDIRANILIAALLSAYRCRGEFSLVTEVVKFVPGGNRTITNVTEVIEGATTLVTTNTKLPTITITCPTGYQLVNGSCEDVDECINMEICFYPSVCNNLPGAYFCDCPPGMSSRKIDMDWLQWNEVILSRLGHVSKTSQSCVYPVSMTQRFGLVYTDQLSNSSSAEYNNLTAMLYESILGSYRLSNSGENIAGINIQRVTPGSVVLHYEVLSVSETKITPTELQNIFHESVNRTYWTEIGALRGVNVDSPVPADPQCNSASFRSRKILGRSFNFPRAQIGSIVKSNESCTDSGYSATISCKKKTLADGTIAAIFVVDTLKENGCTQTLAEILNTLKTIITTSVTVESITDEMSVLSKNLTSSSTDEVTTFTETLEILTQDIETLDIEVTENSLTYLMWYADNLYSAEQMALAANGTLLNSRDQEAIVNALDTFASGLVLTGNTFTLRSKSNVFQAHKINCSAPKEVGFDETLSDHDNEFQPRVSTSIPKSAIPTDCKSSINAAFYIYKDSTFFPSPGGNLGINQILSSQLSKTNLRGLKEPIKHDFAQPNRRTGTEKDILSHRCAYLEISTGLWKYDGCATTVVDSSTTSCSCDHTTNFAVLVQTYAVQSSFALNIVGYVGCSLSALGLVLVLVIYLSFKKLRTNQINQLHIHLGLCLLVTYLTFLFGVDRPRAYVPCMAVGAILQFSLLSAWGWMLAECVTMYKKFVKVFGGMSSKYVQKTAFIVYTISLLATAITVIVAYVTGDMLQYKDWALAADNDPLFHPSYYVSDRLCWLHGYSLYFGFLTPIAVMFLANIAGFIRISVVLTTTKDEIRSSKVRKDEVKDHVFRVLTVSILLGITWAFAVPMTFSSDVILNEIFSWLFSISNAFQGVFIFLLFCVKRKDVRDLWIGRLPRISLRKSKQYAVQATATGSTGISSRNTIDTKSGLSQSDIAYGNLAESRDPSPYLPRKDAPDVIVLKTINKD